jgi:sigma-B regulation protein RsbU (phosphoserine phosphatase)
MTCPRKFWILIIISMILLTGVIIGDLGLTDTFLSPFFWNQIREPLLIGFFIFMTIGFSCLDVLKKISLLAKLRLLGFSVLLFSGGLHTLDIYFPVPTPAQPFEETSTSIAFTEPIKAILFVIVSFLSVWIILTLKELIYIQQGKKTERNYRLLILFILLHIGFIFFQTESSKIGIPNPAEIQVENFNANYFFFILVGLFSFINGFRCKWIHYLNKKQKIRVFIAGIFIHIPAFQQILKIPNAMTNYSITVGTWIDCLLLVYIIYASMTILGLLLQLPSAGLVDRRTKEIQSFQNLSATISSVFDKKELIDKITELSSQILGADFSWIALKENGLYIFAGSQNLSREAADQLPLSFLKNVQTALEQSDIPLLINDVNKDIRTKGIKKWSRKAGSLLAVQVRMKNEIMGFLYAMKEGTFGFVEESRGLFQAFADQAAIALENANLVQVTIEQERYREELRLAHEAQMRLLPQKMPKIPGIDISGFCLTANDIGGDFYDLIEVEDHRLDIVIGDVSGKGASAAFYMAELKGVIQTLSHHYASPKEILIEMNGFLHKHFDPQTFVTVVYGILYTDKHELHFVRAGHPPVGLIRNKTLTWIETQGIGLGIADNTLLDNTLTAKTVRIKKGDTIIFYTDGLTEARNSKNEEFGEDAFKEMLLSLNGLESEEMLQQVQNRMQSYTEGIPRHDDITLVILRMLS